MSQSPNESLLRQRIEKIRASMPRVAADQRDFLLSKDDLKNAFANQHNNWGGFKKGWGSRVDPNPEWQVDV